MADVLLKRPIDTSLRPVGDLHSCGLNNCVAFETTVFAPALTPSTMRRSVCRVWCNPSCGLVEEVGWLDRVCRSVVPIATWRRLTLGLGPRGRERSAGRPRVGSRRQKRLTALFHLSGCMPPKRSTTRTSRGRLVPVLVFGKSPGKRDDCLLMLWNRNVEVVAGEIQEHSLPR